MSGIYKYKLTFTILSSEPIITNQMVYLFNSDTCQTHKMRLRYMVIHRPVRRLELPLQFDCVNNRTANLTKF